MMPRVKIEIKESPTGFHAQIFFDGTAFLESMVLPERIDLRKILLLICDRLGAGDFQVIDEKSPRFEIEKRLPEI